MDKSKLKKLINLLGVPVGMETGFIVGGCSGNEIIKERGCKRTGYSLGGRTGQQIVSKEGEEIGLVAMNMTRNILTVEGVETNYRLGGPNGRTILYSKRSR